MCSAVLQLLLLEATGNALLFANLGNAINYWATAFSDFLEAIVDRSNPAARLTGQQLSTFSDNLALIGMSYKDANGTLVAWCARHA